MNRKGVYLFALILLCVAVLAACGSKGEEDVLGDLSNQYNKMESYKAEATLTLQNGTEKQDFEIEVWHKKPHYYRVGLTNTERDITQIILRNDDGVFVLTPHLNRSFRFQSGWPDNHGQVYLYESLIKDILADTNRQFTQEGGQYIFEVAANYQNKNLTYQRIAFDSSLKPTKVEVMDADYNVMVIVEFSNVEFDYAFEEDAFDMQRNMESAILDSIPTMAAEEERHLESFGVYYPTYLPGDAALIEEKEMKTTEGDRRVVLRYTGDYNFNIVQERPKARMVHLNEGNPVDLGFTVGVMGMNSLSFTYDGVDFLISSQELSQQEMIDVAISFIGQTSK